MNSPRTGTEMNLQTKKAILNYRNEPFEIDYQYYVDEDGSEFITPEMGDANLKQVYDQYNTKYNTNVAPQLPEPVVEESQFCKACYDIAFGVPGAPLTDHTCS